MGLTTLEMVLYGWLGVAAMMVLFSLDEIRRKDASAVDVGWSLGTGLLALFYAIAGSGDPERRLLLGIVASAWAFRLAGFLFVNRIWRKPEDGRYQRMRAALGAKAHPVFFLFFQLQATWAVLFSMPFLIVVGNATAGPGIWDWIGVAIVVGAIVGETLADRQLAAFRANPANKGRTCREGLWHYSRHPNYFFEWVHWFGYIFMAVGAGYWWVTLLAPVVMLLFLFYVTGIPHTEKQALSTRGEDYARYQRETSMFIPLPPRKTA